MTPAQYKAAIKKLGLSQVGAAAFLRINPRTSRHWASDQNAPHVVGLLLRLMIKLGIDPEEVK